MASKITDLTAMTGAAIDGTADVMLIVDVSAGTSGSKKITVNELFTGRTTIGTTTTGTLVVADTYGLTVGGTTAITVSNGDGSTALTPLTVVEGTAKADSSAVLASFSATATSAAAPSLCFLKSANAAVGSNTVVASGEVLGEVVWFGADGTDFKSAAARISCLVDATPGTGDMPGRLVFWTTADNAETLTEAARIDNAQRLIVGGVAAQSVSAGDGSTSSTPRAQLWGTSVATATLLVGCASTTDATSGGVAIVKGGNAAVGSFTTVASGESLGTITWFGDNGTDYLSPAGKIEVLVDATPGAADMPGRMVFSVTADGAETMTEALRIDNAQRVVAGGVAAQTVGGLVGGGQTWGTTAARSQYVLGCASTTDATAAEFAFVKGGNAAVGSFTTVASGEALGAITWYGDNGADYSLAFAQIKAFVDATPGAADAPGRISFYTTPDGSTTLTEALRLKNDQTVNALGRLTTTDGVASGTVKVVGGTAFVDVAASDTVSAVTSNGSFATFAQTYAVPASTLKSGSLLKVKALVVVNDASGSVTLQCQIRLGGTALVVTTAVDPGATTDLHLLEFDLVSRAAPGAAASCAGGGRWVTNTGGTVAHGTGLLAPTNFATNGSLTLDVQAKWSATNASTSARLEMLNVEII